METNRSAPALPRLHFLDALRGVAALAVLSQHIAHYSAPTQTVAMNHWFAPGGFGVQLFFLVSGFVIPLSLDRARSLGHFGVGRFFRLWPLYAAALIAAIVIKRDALPDAAGLVANLVPLTNFTEHPILVPNAWSLAFEIVFYAGLAAAYALGLRRRAVGLATVLLLVALVIEGGLHWGAGAVLPQLGTFYIFGLMLTGTVVYRWSTGEVSGRACARVVLLACAVGALTVPPDQMQVIGTRLAALGVFGVACALRHRTMPGSLLWLGRVSYSLYLLHGLVILAAPRTGFAALDAVLWVALSLSLAALAERWIERPGIALGKRLLSRPRHTAAHLSPESTASAT